MVIKDTKIAAVEPKKASNGNTFYVIHVANGVSGSTFDQQAAIEARDAVGKPANVTFEETFKNGKTFTNYVGLELTNGSVSPDPFIVDPDKIQAGIQVITPAYKNAEREKQESIARQNATRTAFTFIGQLAAAGLDLGNQQLVNECFSLADRLYRWNSNLMPDPSANGVAAEINEAFGEDVVQVGANREW